MIKVVKFPIIEECPVVPWAQLSVWCQVSYLHINFPIFRWVGKFILVNVDTAISWVGGGMGMEVGGEGGNYTLLDRKESSPPHIIHARPGHSVLSLPSF